jgi:hypothetical protein
MRGEGSLTIIALMDTGKSMGANLSLPLWDATFVNP